MVIFIVPLSAPGGRLQRDDAGTRFGKTGLDEPHVARNSQDASSQRSGSEAWIGDEEGSINVH
ncbi:hypothetical protein [Streptomyces sp. NPDC005423]|uniref:hypothetical protein n=1 Tax=Streptomyces sp. NPDC005423 TaxID=3155343 RepID=UPI0033B673B0